MLSMRRNADLRTLAFTTLYFVLFGTIWTQYSTLPSLAWYSLFSLTCYFSFVGAVAVHNTIHCPVFFNKTANKVFQVVLSLTYGHPVSNYVPGHNLSHHQNTQTPKDVMRTTKLRYDWHLLNGLLFFVYIGVAMLGNDAIYFRVQRKMQRPIYKQMKLEQVVLMTVAAVLVVLDLERWVVCALLPHIFAKFCIITLNMLQHDGCDQDSDYNHSRNFVGPLLNFLCYNNGYHSVHHMHPGWHWSILPEKHAELVKAHIHPNLDQPSILLYIFRTFVFPGIRLDYLGQRLKLAPAEPDQAWFYDAVETYSTHGDNFQ